MISRDIAYARLKTTISRFININDEEFQGISKHFYLVTLTKKQDWRLPGDPCIEIIFIVHGCLRTYSIKNNVRRTTQFFFEDSWYTDYSSWFTREPMLLGVEALEPSTLLVIKFTDLEPLYERFPKCERLGRRIAENTLVSMRNRNISLLNDSPEEAYLKLHRERPMVIERIPQHLIASFLGIEPETLSRIRKKLSTRGW